MATTAYEIKLKDLNIWIDVDIVKIDSRNESFLVRFKDTNR